MVCSVCHQDNVYRFDEVQTSGVGWRITNNPLAWGNHNPKVIVLGFSKGPTQIGALRNSDHDSIAYKGGRTNVAKILHHVGLIERPDAAIVDRLLSERSGDFHFGSLIRCTVERFDPSSGSWKGTGGGMLDRFLQTDFGRRVAAACTERFLVDLPERTRLVLMMGMGTAGNYIKACQRLLESARPGPWRSLHDVAYTDGKIVVVHTEHFASQGALIPNWLGGVAHERGRLGLLAREAVQFALKS